MRITCCCITCEINEGKSESEEDKLISSTDEVVPCKGTSKEPVSQSSKRKTRKSSSWGTDEEDKETRAMNIIKKYRPFLSQKSRSSPIVESSIDLKVSFTKMPGRDSVKIFVVDATNINPMLCAVTNDIGSFSVDEIFFIQVRSKLLHSETRGHTKGKYEVSKNFSGSIRFRNECLHSITNTELLCQQIRFRLYIVFKQRRDVLLGEYIFDPTVLDLTSDSNTTNVTLSLRNAEGEEGKPPEIRRNVTPERQISSGSVSQTPSFMRGFSIGSGSSHRFFSFSDSGEKEDESEADKSKGSLTDRSSFGSSTNEGAILENPLDSGEHAKPFEQLKKSVQERKENISQLETASEELVSEAVTFGELSEKLKRKYEKRLSGK